MLFRTLERLPNETSLNMHMHNYRSLVRGFLCAAVLLGLFPVVLVSQETELKPVKKVLPAYPDVLKRAGISGTVRVRAIIGPDGTVKDVTPLGGGAVFI